MPPRPSRCWKTRRFLTGIYFREYPLAPELTPKYYVDVVGDSAEVVEIRPSVLEHWNRPIPEAWAMCGVQHHRSCHFLLAQRGQYNSRR